MVINILGCFIMGVFTAWFAFKGENTSQPMRLLLTTGLLGGFTTFSSFSLDAALMLQRHDYGMAAAYIVGSVALSVAALFAGLAMVRALT